MRRIPHWLDQEDVIEDAVVEILEALKLKRLRTGQELLEEATRAVERVVARRRRERRRADSLEHRAGGSLQAAGLVNLESEGLIQHIEGKLTRGEKRLFRLEYVESLTAGRMAAVLAISANQLACRRYRLRLKLRRLILKYRRNGGETT